MKGNQSNKYVTAITADSNLFTIFHNFDGPNVFFPNSTGPWSRFQNSRKIPEDFFKSLKSGLERSYGLVLEISVLIVFSQMPPINAHPDISSQANQNCLVQFSVIRPHATELIFLKPVMANKMVLFCT